MNGALMTMPELEPRLPQPGLALTQPQSETGDWADQHREGLRGVMRSSPIWHVPQEQHSCQLARPLLISVRKEEEFFFVENETLQIVGIGTTGNEAMEDFFIHLLHFHQYYAKLPSNKVMGEGKKLKELYSNLFTEE